jgi:hypothetical protein
MKGKVIVPPTVKITKTIAINRKELRFLVSKNQRIACPLVRYC